METFCALLALCAGNSPVTGEFPSQRPVTRSFDAFFDLRLNKRLSNQSWGRWFKTPSRSLWRHCNDCIINTKDKWTLFLIPFEQQSLNTVTRRTHFSLGMLKNITWLYSFDAICRVHSLREIPQVPRVIHAVCAFWFSGVPFIKLVWLRLRYGRISNQIHHLYDMWLLLS